MLNKLRNLKFEAEMKMVNVKLNASCMKNDVKSKIKNVNKKECCKSIVKTTAATALTVSATTNSIKTVNAIYTVTKDTYKGMQVLGYTPSLVVILKNQIVTKKFRNDTIKEGTKLVLSKKIYRINKKEVGK